ncbi:MAG TPA: hypothetical protein PLS63_14085, partial [Microthrixaceae bacterium]|nr:hypothetical protein [Microthrixaceae bacterium]
TVANSGAAVDGVTLVEELALPNHTTFVSAEINEHEINNGGPPTNITLNALWNGTTEPSLTEGAFTAPADSDLVFEVHIVFEVDPALTSTEANCPTGGVDNTVTLWRNGQELTHAGACVSMASELQFAKAVADHTYDPDTGGYTITYDLSAHNTTPIPTTFSLIDAPGLSPSVIVAGVTLTDEQSGDVSVLDITAAPFTIATDVAIAGGAEHDYLLAITYAIDPFSDTAADDMMCDGAAGLGLFNSLGGTYPDGGKPSGAYACADVPAPNLQFDKQFVGSTVVDADTLSAEFDITVTNALVDGELVGTAVYQIVDAPVATMGITPGAFHLASVDGGVEGDDYMAEVVTFLGGVDALSAEGLLDPGATHVFHVSIDYDFDIAGGFSGACGPVQIDQQPPGGMFNVLITDLGALFGGDPVLDPETGLPFGFHVACGGAASVGFQKTVVNDDGGTLEPGDVVFDIKGADGAVVETAHDGETVVLPAGEYAVDEEPVPGYTSDGTICGLLGEVIGAAVGPIVPGATTFAAGEDYLCSAINNDLPV